MACVHDLCTWLVCMTCVHDLCVWLALCAWFVCMDCVCDYCVFDLCVLLDPLLSLAPLTYLSRLLGCALCYLLFVCHASIIYLQLYVECSM